MSVKVMALVWEKSEAEGTELLTLLAIADNANDEGIAWPSNDRIAFKTRAGRRSVQRYTQSLIQRGELTIAKRGGLFGNQWKPNVWRVEIDHLRALPDRQYSPRHLGAEEEIGAEAQRQNQPARRATAMALEPPIKPPSEQSSSESMALSVQQVCDFLLPMFGIPAGDFLKLSGEVQHQVGLAKITREEADALLRFYRLPHDSKYPEVKSRKQKLSRFMPEYREQIALALKICAPRKRHVPRGTNEENTVGANLRPPEPTSEPEREAIVQRGRASLAELRQRLGRSGSVANGAENGDIDAGRPAVDTAGDSTIHQ